MSTKRFMVRTPDGAVSGPHSSAELVQLAAGGTLTPECEVQLDGGTAWHPATKVKGLQFAAPAAPAAPPAAAPATVAGASNTVPIFMHLSVLSGLVIPFAGLLVPLVLWLVNRKDPRLDAQGKEVMNWVIFISIYLVVSALLVLVLVGILLLALGAVAVIVFAIMGAIKASKGEFFRYPMPFRLIK
jgi:uncharacterized Tic20 family protein